MIITGNVIAHKVFGDGIEIEDNVSCQLPSFENATSEAKGAGILGTIDMPSSGQLNSMVFVMNMRSANKKSINLLRPGLQNIELRFTQDVQDADGRSIMAGTKIFISGYNKKLDPGKVESPSSMEGSIEFEVVRYRQVIEGEEVLLIDKRNYIFKINGIDYMAKVRAALN